MEEDINQQLVRDVFRALLGRAAYPQLGYTICQAGGAPLQVPRGNAITSSEKPMDRTAQGNMPGAKILVSLASSPRKMLERTHFPETLFKCFALETTSIKPAATDKIQRWPSSMDADFCDSAARYQLPRYSWLYFLPPSA